MDIDLGSFGVGQVVVHEVPAGEQDEAVLSETVDDPGDEPKQFFQRRVVDSLTNAGRRVRFRPAGDDNKSPVPKAIRDLLFERTELLPMSQQCALHLATCQQSGAVSPGLLCVIEGSVDDKRAVGVVKLEMEEGVQLTRKRVEGKRSLTIKSVKELMMSERTRVFKPSGASFPIIRCLAPQCEAWLTSSFTAFLARSLKSSPK